MSVSENVTINFNTRTNDLDRAIGILRNAGNVVNNVRSRITSAGNAVVSFRTNVNGLNSTMAHMRTSGIPLQRMDDDLNNASSAARTLRDRLQSVSQTMRNAGQSIQNVGSSIKNIGSSLTQNVTMPIVKGFGYAIKSSMDFNQQLSSTAAISGATAKEMASLREQALKLGKDTKYSAMEVAEGQEEMLKAGRNLNQVFDEMDDVLSLATAGTLEIARAAEIGSNVVNMFAKEGVKMSEVADLMAGTANASAIDVEEFSKTLEYVGPVAASLNIPLKDLSSVIGVLGNNSIKGSKAGTGLRQFLMRLQPASENAAAVMKELGLVTEDGGNKFYTAEGKIKPLAEVIDILRSSVSGLTDMQKQEKLKDMFGLIASPTILSLLNSNADALEKMGVAINEVGAAEVAEKRMQNFAGAVELLRGSLETFAVRVGDAIAPVLHVLVTAVDAVMETFLELPDSVLGAIVVFAGLVAAIGPIITVVGFAVMAIGGLVSAVGAIAGVIGTVGLPVIAAVVGGLINIGIVLGTVVAAAVYFVNKFIPIIDTLKLLKNLISGDMKGTMGLLTNSFGMSSEAAGKLVAKFVDVKSKAWQIWQVIKDNLAPIFKVVKDSILEAISGLGLFNNSTDSTKKNVTGLFEGLITPIQNFLNYLYKTLDSFGLIPTRVKYANDKTALTFIELNSQVKKHLGALTSVHRNSSEMMMTTNKAQYEKMLNDTKKALDNELKFVSEQMNKKRDKQIKASEELFKSSSALTEKQEAEVLKKINTYYQKQQDSLKKKYEEIKKIETKAFEENRMMTEKEFSRINELRRQSEEVAVKQISDSKLRQRAILGEAKLLSVKIAKDEAMAIIVEANRAYDKTIEVAKKKKADSIATATMQYQDLKVISKEQYDALVKNATNEYTEVTNKARMTKNETVALANQKAGGVIEPAEREAREIEDQSKKIKDVMTVLWEDLKKKIPGIVADLVTDILEELGTRLAIGILSALQTAGQYLKAGLENLYNAGGADFEKAMKAAGGKSPNKKSTSSKKTSTTKKTKSKAKKPSKADVEYYSNYRPGAMGQTYATGTRFAEGGLSLVGERGAELINIPRGAQVYNNQKTQNIMGSGKNLTLNIYPQSTDVRGIANEIFKIARIEGVY
jgi:TP901 family phage tail tape measure protein